MRIWTKLFSDIIKMLVIPYICVVLYVYFAQRSLLYLPATDLHSPQQYNLPISVQDISLEAEDGTKLTAWYKPAEAMQDTFVFFHGNAGHIGYRWEKYKTIIDKGYGLLALSYRGYGTSEGSPTENGLYQDARAAMDYLKTQNIAAENTIIYGESLGTSISTQMALEYPIKLLALEAPFSSIVDVAKDIYWFLPVDIMLKDRHESVAKIAKINDPLIIFHGQPDMIVPIRFGRKLFAAAIEPKKAIYYPSTYHNGHDMVLNLSHIEKYLKTIQ